MPFSDRSVLRDVLKILFQKTYEDRRLRLDGKGKSTEMIICSEVLATGRVSLCLAAEVFNETADSDA